MGAGIGYELGAVIEPLDSQYPIVEDLFPICVYDA